jgi:amidase
MTTVSGHTRRQVLGYGVVGGALLATRVAPGHASANSRPLPSVNFEEATITELRKAMARRRFSATELTQWYLDRIEQLNPLLHAVIETNPDALAIAQRRDAQRFNFSDHRRPLHGIPVIVKDNIATDDQMQTTAGSLALVGSHVRRDAPIVDRLRDAGAIILGKANLSEWANFRGFAPFNGWSARGGFTRNPYSLELDPCGSSSGSAAASAANLATVAVGTETDGSILCPSGEQNLVGIKPTIGLVSQQGIIPIAASQDTAGPMTRTVRDAALLLNVLQTPFGKVARRRLPHDYTDYIGTKSVKRLRLLVDTNYWNDDDFSTAPEVQAVFDSAIDALRSAGARIDFVKLADPRDMVGDISPYDAEFTVLLFEFKVQIAAYLATVKGTNLTSLADLIQFNIDHCADEMKYFGQQIFEMAEATSGDLNDPAYTVARDLNRKFNQDVINGVLAQGYHAIVTPTYSFGTQTAATAGYASMAVPVGFTDGGRSAGFWLTAGFLDEPRLIAVASAIESFFGARRPPQLLGTVGPEPADAGLCAPPITAAPAVSAATTAAADPHDALRRWRLRSGAL